MQVCVQIDEINNSSVSNFFTSAQAEISQKKYNFNSHSFRNLIQAWLLRTISVAISWLCKVQIKYSIIMDVRACVLILSWWMIAPQLFHSLIPLFVSNVRIYTKFLWWIKRKVEAIIYIILKKTSEILKYSFICMH